MGDRAVVGCLAAAAAVLMAGAAQANVDLSTYAGHFNNGAPGQNQENYQIQYVGQPYLGPPVQEATSGSVDGTSWNDFSQASFGVLRAGVHSSGLGGSIQDNANASFEDEIVINSGPLGTHGIATFTLDLTGTVAASGGGYWDYFVSFEQDGADRQLYTGDSYKEALNQTVDRQLTFTLNFVSGVTQHIRLLTSVSSGDFASPGSAEADFSHTALWGGLQSIVVDGQDVTQTAGILSGSGFTYENAATEGVPEPLAWALMLVGCGGLGAVLRRRRAQPA